MGSTARKRYRRREAAKIVPSRAAALRLKERAARPLPAHTNPITGLKQTTTTTLPRSRDRLDLLLQVPDDKRASFLRLHESYDDPHLLGNRFAGYLDQIRAASARGVHVSDPHYGRRARALRASGGAGPDPRALVEARRRLLCEENALGLAVEYCGFGHLSMAEAGVVLGCSKSTVSRRVRQGLDLLERWLRDGDDDGQEGEPAA